MPPANAPSNKYALGVKYWKEKKWEKAFKEFDAEEKDNLSAAQKVRINLLSADCQIELKRDKKGRIECEDDVNSLSKALEDIKRSIKTDEISTPEPVDIYNSLGLAYIKLSKYEEAEKWFSKALDVHRKQEDLPFALLQQNLGGCYFLLERFENAILWNDKAISILYGNKLKEKRAKIHCLLNQGRCYMKIKHWKSSLFYYKEAFRIAESEDLVDEKEKALDGLADCYKEKEEYEQAVETYEKMLKLPIGNEKKIEVEKKLRDTGKEIINKETNSHPEYDSDSENTSDELERGVRTITCSIL